MEGKNIIPPNQKDYKYGLEMAFKLANEKLASINAEEQCRKAGASFKYVNGKETILLDYLGNSYFITLPEIDFCPSSCSQLTLQPREKLLILHYFINADGSPPTGEKITYKEIPDGTTYFPTFYKRAVKPLIDNFTKEPNRLLDISARLGGKKAEFGDLSVTINAFQRVPLTLVLWYGDDELAPEGNILFNSNISGYLSAEDITVLCEIITWKLVSFSREV
ncbi:MAG: DUF3786 domain-containing protein [Chloroflexota bacterium]